ncbi:hypothetical protein RND81_05G172000 [Saponaria officinalis]|uniref:RING-type domain-containing protein n=1 Tax=Saponaria officinalis TaxID=3572 RepID=A0AAW1KTG8_SAPOF
MASMVAKVNNSNCTSHLSSLSVQSKGTRNKRKFRTEHPVSDPNKVVTSPVKDGSSYEFSAEKLGVNSSHEHPPGPCDMCGMCQDDSVVSKLDLRLSYPGIEGLYTEVVEGEEFQDPYWSEITESQLEELVLSNLDAIFRSAIKRIVVLGYTEEVATKAVLRSGLCYGSKDAISNIVDNAMLVLRNVKDINSSSEPCFRDLQQLVKYVLAELVCVLKGVRPFFSTGDALWCLLICDMNVSHATFADGDIFGNKIDVHGSYVSTQLPLKPEPEMSFPIPCKPISSVPCGGPSNVTAPKKSNKDGSTSSSHTPLTPLEKPYSAKKEHALRQKSVNLEKKYRANTSDICKTARLYGYILDKRGKAMADSGNANVKNVSRKSSKETGNVTKETRRTKSKSAKTVHALPAPVAKPKPVVSSGDSEISRPSPTKNDNRQVNLGVNSALSPTPWVPLNKKDEMIVKLIPRVQELKIQLKEWTEWANEKVMQAAQRLGKDNAELKILRQERDEVERLKKEKQTLQENTVKKLSEMENALSKASGQIERANAAVRRLEVENSALRQEMEAAKLRAAESAASCQEVSKREKKTLMESQSWEREKSVVQEELASERRKLCQLQLELEQAKDRRNQLVARWKQEEKTKDELLTRVSSIRKEREQLELSAKSKEHAIKLKAEANLQKYKDEILTLDKEISQLRMETDSSKIAALKRGIDGSYTNRLTNSQNSPVSKNLWDSYQPGNGLRDYSGLGGVTRDRECVMCLSEEMSVVFLPCAHQVVCKKCNELHEKQGMNDCPSCRCPIIRRICVRYAQP